MRRNPDEVKDDWLCINAKNMWMELKDFEKADEHGRHRKARRWSHEMREMKNGWDDFGSHHDGATSVVSYGAMILAAVSSLFF